MTDRCVHIVAYETSGQPTEMVVGATDYTIHLDQRPVLRAKNHRAGTVFVMEDARDLLLFQCKMDGLDPAPWVAINNYAKKQVIDIDHGVMEDGRPILSFPWNGGKNQWWRLEDA
ncbi:MAG: hypothetical protein V4597_05050 [Pseudomonadota bacterium]